MKKNIEFVSVSKELIKHVKTNLDQDSSQYEGQQDLKIGLSNLLDGISSSLLLGIEGVNDLNLYNNEIKCKDLTINFASRKVTRNGQEIILTPKEFDILYFLASNKGQVFTKEQIYNAVWSDNYLLDDSNIMAFIRKLRKKIELNPDNPTYIITIWGIGYKFNDEI